MQNSSPGDDFARTAGYWAAHGLAARRAHWEAHPVVQSVFAQRRGGLTRMQMLAKRLGVPRGRALGLGVGTAMAELELLGLGAVSSYDLYDVTPQLLEAAEAAASSAGLRQRISCRTVDMNSIELPAQQYDVITFVSSLHHVERLEDVLQQCRQALRPGGVFYAQEYIGPNRFAFPPDHVELAKRIYRTLDPRLLCGLPELPTPDPLAVADADPTESIRSEDIVRVCRRVFPATHIVSEDVCLTLILWYGLNHQNLYDTPAGHDLVNWILDVDRALIQAGRVPTYHAEILASKSGVPAAL